MSEIRVLVLCSAPFGMPVLQQLAYANQLACVGIPAHSFEMIERVQAFLNGSNIPLIVLQKERFEQQLTDTATLYPFNLGLSITFAFKIPAVICALAEKGFFNVHPGPLPGYRGPDPVFQQVKNREKLASVCVHKIDEGWDTGPVFMQKSISFNPAQTYGQLDAALAQKATEITALLVKMVSYDLSIPLKIQDEKQARYYPRQKAADVIIDWLNMDACTIIALINAGNPWNKGAVTKINNQIIRIVQAVPANGIDTADNKPGTILQFISQGMLVSTINQQAILVTILYTDEGFFSAGSMQELGMYAGQNFEAL